MVHNKVLSATYTCREGRQVIELACKGSHFENLPQERMHEDHGEKKQQHKKRG
jgi:hypothetical protein